MIMMVVANTAGNIPPPISIRSIIIGITLVAALIVVVQSAQCRTCRTGRTGNHYFTIDYKYKKAANINISFINHRRLYLQHPDLYCSFSYGIVVVFADVVDVVNVLVVVYYL